jgi:hypothetical protein
MSSLLFRAFRLSRVSARELTTGRDEIFQWREIGENRSQFEKVGEVCQNEFTKNFILFFQTRFPV